MRNSQGIVRAIWIFLAGLEAGVGVWASQFIALMAYRPGVAVGYEPMGVLGSLFISVSVASLALTISWSGRDRLRLVAGSLVLTVLMAAVQYGSFCAYRVAGHMDWEPALLWCAMMAVAGLCYGALLTAGRATAFGRQLAGAGLLTAAVFFSHFMTLGALSITPDVTVQPPGVVMDAAALTFVVIMLAVLIIAGGLGAAYIDDAQAAATVMRLRRLADAAREGIVVVQRGQINDANAFFSALVGSTASELVGMDLFATMLRLEPEAPGAENAARRDGWVQPLDPSKPAVPVEIHMRDEVEARFGPANTIITMRDMREQRAAESRIRYLAEHDSLTGLPNRRAMHGRLAECVARSRRTKERFAVICLNLSQFKAINDLHGQAAGDQLLAVTARRLAGMATGASFAARYGGDEFVVVLFNDRDETMVGLADWTQTLVNKVVESVKHADLTVEPGVCVGISLYPENGQDADTLLINADTALQRAKKNGRNSFCFFEYEMDNAVRERRNMARDLKQAIGNGELSVYYQPQVRSDTGELCGFEALMRWRHPEHGMVPPDTFIVLAEEQGLILELGEWVLRQACIEAAAWPKSISVAVNLSPIQLGQHDLADRLRQMLFETGLSPSRLELEVTETALIRNYQEALDALRRLKAMGVRVAMDDFGTGFSSLSTLQAFPFDKIKIDKSFVQGIGQLERSTVIVRAVLGIGRGLGVPVVAEGVETQDQLAFLRAERCEVIQGYLIGKPAPIAQHRHLMEAPVKRARKRSPKAAA